MTIEENVSLKEYTTFHIGGSAEYFATARSTNELVELLTWAQDKKLPVTIIAGGSNILISDSGIKGLVIKIEIAGVSCSETKEGIEVVVGAGVVFDELVSYTIAKNLWGLENLSGIPGSAGATPIQNVGAYGVEVSDHIQWVEVLDIRSLQTDTLSREQCKFGYRDSIFKHKAGEDLVILSVAFLLRTKSSPVLTYKDLHEIYADTGTSPSPHDIRDTVIEIRSKKFPDWNTVGTAGSFFKNPIVSSAHVRKLLQQYPDIPHFPVENGGEKISLGWVLDHVCGLRGYAEGNVATYKNQALVLVNNGSATEEEVFDFAAKISAIVKRKIDVDIKWEVTKLL